VPLKFEVTFCVRGVISPLLSNLYLHWFDKVFHRADGPAQWARAKLVRYADDFVVLERYQGSRLTGWLRQETPGRQAFRLCPKAAPSGWCDDSLGLVPLG
jgi:retron-type reverse transcriptase